MSQRGRATSAFALLGAVLALAGCGADVPDVRDGTRPTTVAVASLNRCPSKAGELPRFDDHGAVVGSGRLPDGFEPARVVRCRWSPEEAAGSLAEDEVVIAEDRAPALTPAFLEALALPDQTFAPDSRLACAAVARSLQLLILVDAGGLAVVPHLPQDPCHNPRDEVDRAEGGLAFTLHKVYRFEAPR